MADPQAPGNGAAGGETVFVPGVGIVSREEADRIRQTRGQLTPDLVKGLSMSPPPGLDQPVNLPPGDPNAMSARIVDALPEALGLGASFIPIAGEMSLPLRIAARFAYPGGAAAVGEAAREKLTGEPLSGENIAVRGISNALPSALSVGGDLLAKGGSTLMKSAIAAGRTTTAATNVTGAKVAQHELTAPLLTKLVESAKEFGASISEKGVARLQKMSVDLENKLLAVKDPATRKVLQQKLSRLDQLIPEVNAVVNKAARGGVQAPRFAAGAGLTRGMVTSGLVGAGSFAGGMDPQTAALVGLLAGLPVGLVEASPRMRMMAGHAMTNAPGVSKGLETLVRSMLAGEEASTPKPVGSGATTGAARRRR